MTATHSIIHKDYDRPWIYAKQEEAIFCTERYGIVEASTKSGKTHGCILWLSEEAMRGQPGWNYWWIAPVYGQARIAYNRLKRGFPRHVISRSNDTEMTITLSNGATMRFLSGEKPDNLYGEDVHAAVIDEATRLREEAWHAVRSTLTATRGPVRIIGNVRGRRNWAYQLARRAEAGEPNMHYARITALDAIEAGILDDDEVMDAKSTLPPEVFKQLYDALPTDDEGNPFGIDAIRSCVSPLSRNPVACWGWDLAKSLDWTVGIGIDKNGQVVQFERWQKPWDETIDAIQRITGRTRALIDSTGVGDPIVETLQRRHIVNSEDNSHGINVGGGNFEGFIFSPGSKQKIMEGLARAIQSKEVFFPDGPIVSELEAFEYSYTRTGVRYGAPPTMHDDCVVALALAVEIYSTVPKGNRKAVSLMTRS